MASDEKEPSLISCIAEIIRQEHVIHKNSTQPGPLDMYITKATSAEVNAAPTQKKRAMSPLALLSHTATRFLRTDLGDNGWWCGYRNSQMLFSCLSAIHPRWRALLSAGLQGSTTDEALKQVANGSYGGAMSNIPTRATSDITEVLIIQRWIEEAWKSGNTANHCTPLAGGRHEANDSDH